MSNYLMHYGVKGMKWGVRKNPTQYNNGKLTKRGYSKYYTDGKLNSQGQRAKKKAISVKKVGQSGVVGRTATYGVMAYGASQSAQAARLIAGMLHGKGNIKITQMAAKGASYGSRRAVAAAYIAAMGAVKVAAISPYAAAIYRDTRYRLNDNYRNKINSLSELDQYEKTQRKKKTKR